MILTTTVARSICWRCSLSTNLHRSIPFLHLKKTPISSIITCRHYAAAPTTSTEPTTLDPTHTRNIGIIAHIDAGKTTTTERMLYFSGFMRHIGSVDEGSTVMDYLPAERARGITITSAAITFSWTPPHATPHTINLIDTPGHADFTFEVARAIRVLDGAVTILDGVAGVEAQTETVWRQAAALRIPRIVFVNKLDRVGARYGATVAEIARKLHAWPAVLQLPVYDVGVGGGEDLLRGVVDVVEKRVFDYGGGGVTVRDYGWLEAEHPAVYKEAVAARVALVELLSEHDEAMVEAFLAAGSHALVPSAAINASLRTSTLTGDARVVPVLCGASFRNIGVQPLLDAVVAYLPSPSDRPPVSITHGRHQQNTAVLDPATTHACALAFKVVHDAKRGMMVFVRVYSGILTRAQNLLNTSLGTKERAHRLLRMYADAATDIAAIPAGHIGVIIGLKTARTGDTLVADTHHSSTTKAHKHKHSGSPSSPSSSDIDYRTLHLRPIAVPAPVFFAALEPDSISAQKDLDTALSILLREDPSLSITTDPESAQTLLCGMGELHLEIARDRLVRDLKAKASMGSILIAYRETISNPSGSHTHGLVTAKVVPAEVQHSSVSEDGTSTSASVPADLTSPLPPSIVSAALSAGATAALARGPYLSLPLRDVSVHVSLPPDTPLDSTATPASISTAARTAVAAALAAAGPGILIEPVMNVVISTDEASLGRVVADITSARGGHVVGLDSAGGVEGGDGVGLGGSGGGGEGGDFVEMDRVWTPTHGAGGERGGREDVQGGERMRRVVARVPLREMVGYLKHLRAATGGRGTFVMSVEGWERVAGNRALRVEAEIRGY